MADQARSGPYNGDGAMGGGAIPPLRDEAGDPGLMKQAKDSVRDAREQVMTEVRDRTDQAKQTATRVVDERTRTLSESVSALASAFDAAAGSLREGNQNRLAEWTRELSGRARRIASYLEESDTRGLVNDLEGTARENPTVFAGTSFAAGLAAGRFLRSSARPTDTGAAMGDRDDVDVTFRPDAALVADTKSARPGDGYGNTGSGYGTTGSSLGATRSGGAGDAGFGPTRTEGFGATPRQHTSTGGSAMASRAAGSAPSTTTDATGTPGARPGTTPAKRTEPSREGGSQGGAA